jgi:hypothetical protein
VQRKTATCQRGRRAALPSNTASERIGQHAKKNTQAKSTHKPFIEIRPAAAAAAAAARELNNTTAPHKHMKIVSRRLLFSSTSRAHELAFNELALEASSSNHSSVKHTSSK